jgi:AraC family transcriptional regulator of adaptative response / DNA-3-methyladenine glycosylase II
VLAKLVAAAAPQPGPPPESPPMLATPPTPPISPIMRSIADHGEVVVEERSNHDNKSMIDGMVGGGGGGFVAFPSAERVLDLPDDAFAMPAARRGTIRVLAEAIASGELALDPGADRAEAEQRLTSLPGVGAWTAGYVALRALGDPDIFLATDVGVRRGAAALGLPHDARTLGYHSERWRPWRSYALIRLWRHA